MKDRIEADIEALEQDLIDLNLMMVVDPKDSDVVGKTTVKFSEGGGNASVFDVIKDHPVHTVKMMKHWLLVVEHDDTQEYREKKQENY